VRRSTNQGATWTLPEDYVHPTGSTGFARAMATDAWGTIYVGGYSDNFDTGVPIADQYHWVVRASSDGGATWTTSDDALPTRNSTGVQAMTSDSNGNVYAAGYDFDDQKYHWRVRKLARQATTWTNVDDFNLAASDALAVAATTGQNGTIYIGGYAKDAAGLVRWLVRSSADRGTTWTNSDSFAYQGQYTCTVRAMTFEPIKHNVYAAGRCWDGSNYHWIVRKSTDQGLTWSTEDDFVYQAGLVTYANGIDSGGSGNVFATGVGSDGTTNHWIVRQQVCH
jgi:hypothetical protein